MKLRSHLLALVMAVLVPMIAFSAVVVVAFGRQQRAAVERGAVETTRALMNAVDESLNGSVSQLTGLAHARSLARGDLREFDADVKHALLADPDWYTVLLYSPDGTPRVSGLHPFGATTMPRADRAAFDTLRATREPVVGDLAPGPMPGLYHVPIMVPVLKQEAVHYVLIALVKPASLVPVLTRQRIPEEWVSSIFDRNKRIVVRTKGLEQFIGKPVSSEFVTLLERGGREGTATTRTLEGVSVFTAYVRSPLTGWGIGLGIPAESVYSPLQLSLVAVVGGGLVVIALALALAAVVGRRITGPITTLARGARAFGQGASMDAGVPVGVNEIDDVRRAFQEAGTLVRQRALEAEKANRTKDEFLAVLSHELRTPLNAVYGWARMLQAGQVDEATTARALDVIVRQSNSQVQLIDDLLDVSRMSVGKMRLDVRQVDLPAVVEHALDAVRPAAAAKSIRLQPVLDPRGGPVVGDPDRLQQVVWNLLMNAVKFTPRNGRVQLYLQRVTSHVEIVVSDDGPGIPPEVLPFIFEPFRQGDSSSTRAHSGLGLGLALVRHLVDLHGGSVTAQSDGAGGGATFVVRLPLPLAELGVPGSIGRAHPKAGSEPPHRGEIIRLDGVRVVVADDDPEALELASSILGGAGGEVRTCSSVEEALEAFRQSVPDVLISDIEMPGEDGYSLIRRVRALPAEQGGRVPAVALTAYGRTQDRVQSLAAGFTMHVPKPVDPGELTTIVASVCRISGG